MIFFSKNSLFSFVENTCQVSPIIFFNNNEYFFGDKFMFSSTFELLCDKIFDFYDKYELPH